MARGEGTPPGESEPLGPDAVVPNPYARCDQAPSDSRRRPTGPDLIHIEPLIC